jgi:hypothetical protein
MYRSRRRSPNNLEAGDGNRRDGGDDHPGLRGGGPGSGLHQFSHHPRTPTDARFINNEGQGLDTGCTYRSGGPLVITVPVDRVTSMVAIGGRLVDPAGAVRNGVVSQYATLRLPAFDIDLDGSPTELDRVLFNGVEIGQLTGANGQWKLNGFRIPGAADLRVSQVQAFNRRNAGNLPFSFTVDGETRPMVYNAVSADANLDDSVDPLSTHDHYIPTIQRNKAEGVLVFGLGVSLAERGYRLLGEVLYTTVEPVTLGASP